MARSLRTAYICWACGGLFGLHHFYLGRDVQAFVWFITLGGGIVGWLRDFRNLPKYVDEANGEGDSVEDALDLLSEQNNVYSQLLANMLRQIVRNNKPCSASWTLLFGQVIIGALFSTLFHYAIPPGLPLHHLFRYALMVAANLLGAALGIYLVSNTSPYKLQFKYCFTENALVVSMYTYGLVAILLSSVVAHSANQKLEWASPREMKRPRLTLKHLAKRCVLATVICFIYLALFYHAVCHNRAVVTSDGRPATVQEVTSAYWVYYKRNGVRGLYANAVNYVDPKGKYRAYWTLGFRSPWMTSGDLKAHCRRLSARWHPDKFSSVAEKDYADATYKAVNNACDTLKKLV